MKYAPRSLQNKSQVFEELAPELLPALMGVEGPNASYIPITNSLLGELQRRGVTQEQLEGTLRTLGACAMPPATLRMLQRLHDRSVHDVRILSDCNTVGWCYRGNGGEAVWVLGLVAVVAAMVRGNMAIEVLLLSHSCLKETLQQQPLTGNGLPLRAKHGQAMCQARPSQQWGLLLTDSQTSQAPRSVCKVAQCC